MEGSVAFENVTFRYQADGANVLEDVSFRVQPGEVVGVIGASGAGKTSILRLLQRLYVPQEGRVLVDGVNLAGVDPAWLRRQMGVVMQESVLFSGTVRENIALGQPDLPINQVEEAARLAGADQFIRGLPQAYETPVGERGARLSEGQRQRIAIARALAMDPKILLLDEPASALDYESERTLQENLAEIASGRTVFLVAHRLSTLRIADRILALENGRLVEDGRPGELLGGQGPFGRLYRAQSSFSAGLGSVGVAG
jgi:subfamily B ATP-binding cassette protein HlyB/CyaB